MTIIVNEGPSTSIVFAKELRRREGNHKTRMPTFSYENMSKCEYLGNRGIKRRTARRVIAMGSVFLFIIGVCVFSHTPRCVLI